MGLPAIPIVSDPGLDNAVKSLDTEQISSVVNRILDRGTGLDSRSILIPACIVGCVQTHATGFCPMIVIQDSHLLAKSNKRFGK